MSAPDAVEMRFRLSGAEWRAAVAAAQGRVGGSMSRRGRVLRLAALALAALAVGGVAQGLLAARLLERAHLAGFAAGAVVIALIYVVRRLVDNRRLSVVMDSLLAELGEHRVRLGPDGLSVATALDQRQEHWAACRAVIDLPDFLMLQSIRTTWLPLPRTALPPGTSAQELAASIARWREEAAT